jgi:phosphoglycerol transferase
VAVEAEAPEDTREDPVAPAASRSQPTWRTGLIDVGIVAAITAGITAVLYRVWTWPMDVPFTYQGDSIGLMAFAKIVAQTGWYTATPRAGAPFGLNTYDFPYGGDNGWWLLLKGLTWFTHDPAVLVNVLFLLGFVLVAVSAFVALRVIGIGRLVSGVLGIIFAFAPWHFLRTTGQLFIGAPLSVPLAIAVALRLLAGDTPLLRDGHRWRDRLDVRTSLSIFALGTCVVLGSFDTYYTVFGALVIAVAGAMAALARRIWRPLASAAVVVAATTVVLILNSIPTLLWHRSHGANPEVAVRPIEDLDTYALRPVQLLAPVPQHRLSPLAHLSALLTRPGSQSEPYQYLGLVAVVGVALALGSLLVWAAGRRSDALRQRAGAGALIVVLAAFGVAGGLSWLAFTGGLAQIRSWNRVAILIAFLGLVALGSVLDAAVAWMRRRHWRAGVVVGLAVVLVGLALFDQLGRNMVADPRRNEAAWDSDAQFVSAIGQQLPPNANIYVLPYLPWPEGGTTNAVVDQDLWRGFIHSDDLRWSFAGMRGREADWQEYTSRLPTGQMVDALTAAGFDGIYLDRLGYADRTVESDIQAQLGGQPPMVSADGRLVFFDLRPHLEQLNTTMGRDAVARLGDDTLHRPRVEYRDGFAPRTFGVPDVEHGARTRDTLQVVNDSGTPFDGQLTFSVNAYSPGDHNLTVRTPDGTEHDVTISPDGDSYTVPITVPPGQSEVVLTTDAPEVSVGYRDLAFNLADAFVTR